MTGQHEPLFLKRSLYTNTKYIFQYIVEGFLKDGTKSSFE